MAASIAAGLGLASAAVSAVLGARWHALVLDTVGGGIERWAGERSGGVVAALSVIVVLKLVGAFAPLMFAGVGTEQLPVWTRGRWARLLAWLAAVGLAAHGSVLTIAGLLVEAGVVEPAADADEHALAWHA